MKVREVWSQIEWVLTILEGFLNNVTEIESEKEENIDHLVLKRFLTRYIDESFKCWM